MPYNSNASTQLRASGARLRAAGVRDVRLSMMRQLRLAAVPVVASLQQEALDVLPKSGGMNEFVAAQKPKVSIRTTGRNAGVSIKSKVKGNYTDQGQWRHPVFSSDRKRWTKQPQTFPGAKDWWKRGAEKAEPAAKIAMSHVLDDVAAEIMRLGL